MKIDLKTIKEKMFPVALAILVIVTFVLMFFFPFYFYIVFYVLFPIWEGREVMVFPLVWGAVSTILLLVGIFSEKTLIEDFGLLNYLFGLTLPLSIALGHPPTWVSGLITIIAFGIWKVMCLIRKYEKIKEQIKEMKMLKTNDL